VGASPMPRRGRRHSCQLRLALENCVTARLCRDNHASLDVSNERISPVAQQGTVKWFNSQKGFGFIQPEGGGNDVFVHISAVEQAGLSQLSENQRVSFETETGRNGKVAAVNLKVV
jgi:CspA family cold shock protein